MTPENLFIYEFKTPTEDIASEVIRGLSAKPKRLPSRLLYDKIGAALFEKICKQPEYYVTRAEMEILRDQGEEIAQQLSAHDLLIEPGAGAMEKAEVLLGFLPTRITYMPIDIAAEQLKSRAAQLAAKFPKVHVKGIIGNFHQTGDWKTLLEGYKRPLVFFPGSTIGNIEPGEAIRFLRSLSKLFERPTSMLVGVDLKKDHSSLNAAYNDAKGVTEAFEMNILTRLNRDLGANFDPDGFVYSGSYNPDAGRMEMYLVSHRPQRVSFGVHEFQFEEGERLHIESSYKYSIADFKDLIKKAELHHLQVWRDSENLFSLHLISDDPSCGALG